MTICRPTRGAISSASRRSPDVPIQIVSVGPGREETIVIDHPIVAAVRAYAAVHQGLAHTDFDGGIAAEMVWSPVGFEVEPDTSAFRPFSDGSDFDAVLLFKVTESFEGLALTLEGMRGYLVDVRTGGVIRADTAPQMPVRANSIHAATTALIDRLLEQYQPAW
jgi:hypothetical protein